MHKVLIFGKALLLVIFLMQTPVAVAAKDPIRLKPSSKWVSNWQKDGCRLIRQFGEDEDTTTLIFYRYGPTDEFKLTVAGRYARISSQRRDLAIQFGPSEKEQDVSFGIGTLGKKKPAIITHGLSIRALTEEQEKAEKNWEFGKPRPFIDPITAEQESAVNHVLIGKPFRKPLLLETGSMGKPFAALDACIDELLTHWGIDAEAHKTLTRSVKPATSPGRWIKSSDYPTNMLRRGQPAVVEFRMNIDSTGKATACHIQATTRPKEFDDAVCGSLMKRAKFIPALDAEGQPIASYYRNTVRFQIP